MTLQNIFSNDKLRENTQIIQYTLGMLLLRNKLNSNRSMQQHIHDYLERLNSLQLIDSQITGTDNTEVEIEGDEIYRQLAKLYSDTISSFGYQIQVTGAPEYLKDERVADKVRTLLLAGVRSAVLWHQLGGRRWRLVVYRKSTQQALVNIRRSLVGTV